MDCELPWYCPQPAMSQKYFCIEKKLFIYTHSSKNTCVHIQLYTRLSQNMCSDQPCADCKVSGLDMKEMKFPEVFLSNVAKRMIITITRTRPVLDEGLIGSTWQGVSTGGCSTDPCGE